MEAASQAAHGAAESAQGMGENGFGGDWIRQKGDAATFAEIAKLPARAMAA
jgi:hypothetical protein